MARHSFSTKALVAAAALCCLSALPSEAVSRRVALVIGNAAYTALPALDNSVNDAEKMRDTLHDAGFEIYFGANLTHLQVEELLRKFFRDVDNADIATIYYSGHGVQVAGDNFIVPVDAKLATPYDIEQQTFKVGDIFRYLTAHSRAQLIFLDACRNNPFQTNRFWIGDTLKAANVKEGLARANYGVGSLIAFSTEPGAVAYDGTGSLSPYTTALANHITAPNEEIRRALTLVRREVIKATDGLQVPWENSALVDDVYLMPAPPGPKVAPMVRMSAPPGERLALNFPVPTRSSDDGLEIRIDAPPDHGKLWLDGKPLATRELTIDEFERLAFDSNGLSPGAISLMTYSVTDKWAQTARGVAAITVNSAQPPPPPPRDLTAEAASALAKIDARNAAPIVAVGPVNLRLDAKPVEGAPAVVVERAPALGVLRLGERTLSARQQFAFADLARLDYQPSVGAEGRKDGFALTLAGASKALATVALAPVLDGCDREAASPLDLQGVGPGKLPNEINVARATEACQQAVAAYPGVARFAYQLGRALLAAGKTAEAKTWIEKAAAAKHTRAAWELGNLETFGALGAADLAKANVYYKQCADAGDAYCSLAYGRNLYYGRGVAQDAKAGLELILRAAALGHTYAMNELGYIFLYGKGQPVDAERGIRFYEAGAERADIYSLNNLGLVYLRGLGRPANPAKAASYFTRASAGGHPYAPTNLGRMARDGIGERKDLGAARRWFELAAERGDYWGALDRANMEGDKAVAAKFLALAVSLNRQDDNYDADKQAEQALAKIPAADQQRALDQLAAQGVAVAPGADVTAQLIETQGRAWRSRNPRFDLF
ncbi:MAG: caspase family protein [Pseudomonadota bacterium]|nr:caspase family protein [Pseudomonadota bacterium]